MIFIKNTDNFFYIPPSYGKLLLETKFQLPEYPRSGSKAMRIEERKREEEVLTMVSTYTWTN